MDHRGVHESVAPSRCAKFPVGRASVIAARHPELWGGLVDLAISAATANSGRHLPNLAKPSKSILVRRDGVVLAPGLGSASVASRRANLVSPTRPTSSPARHDPWPADGRLARRPAALIGVLTGAATAGLAPSTPSCAGGSTRSAPLEMRGVTVGRHRRRRLPRACRPCWPTVTGA